MGISIARRAFLAAHTTAFLLALGGYLEHSIERRSDELLMHLLQPATVEVWVERDGRKVLMDAADLAVGEMVIATTGTVIPVDGTVLSGEALVKILSGQAQRQPLCA